MNNKKIDKDSDFVTVFGSDSNVDVDALFKQGYERMEKKKKQKKTWWFMK